ncbi:membrane protein [Companilactobacillus crustorum]|uniref:Membrane protein n=1 Tax=Companilactobacillus crustorum TaxID=392416 RepID=A0AB34AE92_9LACO|nr:membrane protein [Companilactobacillus crustorum]
MISGLILNAFGNGLCISANMGSGLWTASAVNLNKWLGWNTGLLLFIIGVINAITNQFLIKRFDGKRLVGEVLYVLFFSYFVNIFTDLLNMVGVPSLPIVIRAILSCLGVAFFCVAISLYQRANIVMHPNDDTTNILRFLYLKGNSTAAQIIDFIPPIIIIIVAGLAVHNVYSVNVGTIFSFIFNGILIASADKFIWPSLKHNFKAQVD